MNCKTLRKCFSISLCGALGLLGCKDKREVDMEGGVLSVEEIQGVQRELESGIDSEVSAVAQALAQSDYADAGSVTLDGESAGGSRFGLQGSSVDFRTLGQRLQAAWNASGRSACKILRPFIRSGGSALNHPYFVVGASAQAGAGMQMVVGRDFVWDFYNLQFGTFTYKAPEVVLGSGTVGASTSAYAGLAYGIRGDVDAAWSGYFSSVAGAGSLPILADYLSGSLMAFAAADGKGRVDLSFVGASVGISAAISVPTTAPGALTSSIGFWTIDQKMNKQIAAQWRQKKIPVADKGDFTCGGKCVRFDATGKGVKYRDRAFNLALSMPLLVLPRMSAGTFPGFEKFMLLALATGAFRDVVNAGQACSR